MKVLKKQSTFAENLQKDAHLHRLISRRNFSSLTRKRALTDVLPKHGKTGDRSVISYEATRAICCKHWTLRVTHVQLRISAWDLRNRSGVVILPSHDEYNFSTNITSEKKYNFDAIKFSRARDILEKEEATFSLY